MKIIIPMAGTGERFLKEGYSIPKPLIKINGKYMIEHAINIFSDDNEFVFLCNKEHLEKTEMEDVLQKLRPNSIIIPVEGHRKGPVYSVLLSENLISDNEKIIVNYSDFTVEWDYKKFISLISDKKIDGCIPVFKEFNPSSLGTTNYAYLKTDSNMNVLEIREKQSFTNNRMNEFASTGTYYFRSGALLKKYFRKAMEEKLSVKGEYYSSLPFNLLIKDGFKIVAFEVKKFICFGTPVDIQNYMFWYDYFKNIFENMYKGDKHTR